MYKYKRAENAKLLKKDRNKGSKNKRAIKH